MPAAVAIGIFDGVHTGHRTLLGQALRLATAEQLRPVVLTFHPHPVRVLRPDRPLLLLEPLSVRLRRLQALGFAAVHVQPFDRAFATMAPEVFMRQVLGETLQARHVVVGSNFTFGHRQGGNIGLLQERGPEQGLTLHAMPLLAADDRAIISSTLIRALVSAGDVVGAGQRLGHPVHLEGLVVHGAHRGSGFGFPTANLQVARLCLPGRGVYAGWAHTSTGSYRAVVNIGLHPTVGDADGLKIEAHLMDYPGDALYGETLELDLLLRLRDEQRFPSVADLLSQIGCDVAAGRAGLTAAAPSRLPPLTAANTAQLAQLPAVDA